MQELKTMEHEAISKIQVMRSFQKEITIYKNPFIPPAIIKEFDKILADIPQDFGTYLERIELLQYKAKHIGGVGGLQDPTTNIIQISIASIDSLVPVGLKAVMYHEFAHNVYDKTTSLEQKQRWDGIIKKFGFPTAYIEYLKSKGKSWHELMNESHAEMVAYMFAKQSKIEYGKKFPDFKVYEDVAEQLLPYLIEIFNYHKYIPLVVHQHSG